MRKALVISAFCLAALACQANVMAQEVPSFDSRHFLPIAGANGAFSVESSQPMEHLVYNVKVMGDYAYRPLTFTTKDVNGNEINPALEHALTLNVAASIGVLDIMEFGVVVPIIGYEGYNEDFANVDSYLLGQPSRGYVGDVQLRAKARILDRKKYNGFGLGAGMTFSFPTGDETAFMGDGFLTGKPYFVLDYAIGPVEMMLNLGFTFRQQSTYVDYTSEHTFDYSFGLVYHVVPDLLDLRGEIFASTPLSDNALRTLKWDEEDKRQYGNYAEWLLGVKFFTPANVHITAGAGTAIGDGVGSPVVRAFLGIEYTPLIHDTDKDGVHDEEDLCPLEPGSKEFSGCQDPDTDGDGWCDPWIDTDELAAAFNCQRTDMCPDVAGDDDRGCPVVDTDKDKWCDPWVEEADTESAENVKTRKLYDEEEREWVYIAVDQKPISESFACQLTDVCPEVAGTDDFNGCPVPDTDNDGWCDPWVNTSELAEIFHCQMTDHCPELAGTDEFNGCPNPDEDGDGICAPFVSQLGLEEFLCNGKDMCPTIAEDFDNFEDEDGCPDYDNDRDGICDPWVAESPNPSQYPCIGVDKCPLDPETINGFQDDDGCPDKGKQRIFVMNDKIEVRDVIYFDTNKATIKKKSNSLLDQLALNIIAHQEIQHLSIEGHTDDTGTPERNRVLSRERAESVMNYLISKGVPAQRLSAKGYGSDRPIAQGKSSKARALNRRVEFIVVK